MPALRPPSTMADPAEGGSGKVKGNLKKVPRTIQDGLGLLRVRGRVRKATLTSLLHILLLLGPVVSGKPPSTLILESDQEDLVVTVSEEDLPPRPGETRCITMEGEVDCLTRIPLHVSSGSADSPQPPNSISPKTPAGGRNATTSPPPARSTRTTANLRVYLVIAVLVVAGLGVVVIYLYLRYGQTPRVRLGASVQPGVGKGPVTIPLLPMVTPNLNTAEVPGLDAINVLPKHSPRSPRPHFAPYEPRDGDQIRGMSPGCRTGLAMTVPTPRRRLPTPETRSIGTPELKVTFQNLRRDILPFDLDQVIPFRFWL